MTGIEPVLGYYAHFCQPGRIEPLGSSGGMSGAQFWRITAACGNLRPDWPDAPDVAHTRLLLLRRWPIEHPTPDRLRFIHEVLAHAARRGITIVPVPFTTRDGQSFVDHAGFLWELAPWMPGTADFARAPSVAKLSAAMKALAHFHIATQDFPTPAVQRLSHEPGTSPAVIDRLARLHELARGGQQQLARAISDEVWPVFAPLARQFLAALPIALPRAIDLLEPLATETFSLQPCMRDIWHDHVLFSGDQVSGIVDFGAMDFDTPACDVARLLGSLVGHDAAQRQIGLEAYDSVRKLANTELRAVAAFDTIIVLLAGCNWIRWIYVEGRQFENASQILERFQRIAERTDNIVSARPAATSPRTSPA
jgi:Ser/Thr protein kinase RdoA (MazF antagonist)